MDTSTTHDRDLTLLFGLEELTETERETYLAEVGTTVFESALLSFLLSLRADEREVCEDFIQSAGEGTELMEKLVAEYPAFADALTAEIERFRTQALALLDPEVGQ